MYNALGLTVILSAAPSESLWRPLGVEGRQFKD
jgi:hypothetical protein